MKDIVAYISFAMFICCCILGLIKVDFVLLILSTMYAIAFQLWKEDNDIFDD